MRAVALVLAATMVCGCSSGGSADLDLGTAAPPTTTSPAPEPTTTEAPTTTSTPVATDAPTTTAAAPTTAAPTTLPDTTTSATPLSKEDQVRADFLAARQIRQQCSYAPSDCRFDAVAIPDSPMDIATRREVAASIANHIAGKPGFGDVKVNVESVGFEGEYAFVTACAFDTGVLFDLADLSNPNDDTIVDDSIASYRVRWEMHSLDGRWLIFDNKAIDQLTGGDLCGF